jgi:hypothetical protein
LVVVGDLIGSGEAQERGIVGETPNLAARLQSIAEPNTVAIADNTRKLLGGLFELQDLGGQGVRAAPVLAREVLFCEAREGRWCAVNAGTCLKSHGRWRPIRLPCPAVSVEQPTIFTPARRRRCA